VSQFLPVFPAHGKDGARLNDNLEQFASLIIEIEQIAYQNEVTGAGNGEKLGESLDDAQNQGFQ
jgi:hypothetical protein